MNSIVKQKNAISGFPKKVNASVPAKDATNTKQ